MARFNQRNNKWQVVIELGRDELTGKRLRHTKDGFKTKKEAQSYALIKENELLNGINHSSNKILLKDFIDDWFTNHVCKTLGINTIANYKSRINTHILPYLGEMQLCKIKNTHIQKFYYNIMNKGIKAATAKKVIQTLNSCFKYAKKLNLVSINPVDIEFFKDDKEETVKVWTEDQLLYFLNEIKNDYLYLPVLIASLTGIRIGELCGLRWENIDTTNNLIYIKEQVLYDKISKKLIHTNILKTSKSNRVISIPQMLSILLDELKRINSTKEFNDFIILDRHNKMCNPRNISVEFSKKVAKYKLSIDDIPNPVEGYLQLPQITFHDLRHTHATILLKHGENIKVIAERLGHTSVKITLDTYSHVLPSMTEHTANLLENIFNMKEI